MIRNIAIGVVVLLVVVVGGAYLTPQVAHVQRSVVVQASPEDVFSVVNDWTRFNEWSPWAKLDPATKYTLDGPPTGVGAKMSWTSEVTGNGSQEIIESDPFKSVKSKLEFGDQGPAFATFTFEAVEGGTKVVWAFESDLGMNPVSRYMGLMFDRWIGKDYENGLASLKTLVEAQALAATKEALEDPGNGLTPPDVPGVVDADPTKGPEVVTVTGRPVITTRGTAASSDDVALSEALGGAYQKILTFAEANGLEIDRGAQTAVTVSHANGQWVFDAAMPLRGKAGAVAEADGVKVIQSYSGRAVKVTHKGAYSSLNQSYAKLHAFTKTQKLREKDLTWEEYVGEPGETADEALLTNVYIAIE